MSLKFENILLNTMPKSGSVFIRQTIFTTLKNSKIVENFSNGYGLLDQLNVRKFIEFVESPIISIAQAHLEASNINLQLINYMDSKLVLHLRDPRQAMISWIHHLDRITGNDYKSEHNLSVHPAPNKDYYSFSFEEKVDWQIKNYLPQLNKWTFEWLTYAEKNKEKILVTEFNEIKKIDDLICKIFDFFNIQHKGPILTPEFDNIDTSHFRKGKKDEFLDVMNKKQIETCSKIAPNKIYDRFGWIL